MRIAAFCFAVLFAAMLLIPSIFAMLGREIQTENGAENTGQKNTEAIVDTDGRTSATGEETENIKNADASGTEISEKNEGITAQKHPLADDLKLDIVRQTVDDEVITVRPADLIEPELEKYKEETKGIATCEEDVLSYALFPQVAQKFFAERGKPKEEGKPETKAESTAQAAKVDETGARILYVEDVSN